MKKLFLVLTILLSFPALWAQTITGTVRDASDKKPLQGVAVLLDGTLKGMVTDSNGNFVLTRLLRGKLKIHYSCTGYQGKDTSVETSADIYFTVELTPLKKELEEVIVQSTRTNRNLSDIPTRIEAITPDELDEKGTMKPGDIRMLLNESTGITTQTTSPVSGSATMRIQGLDGRYTQMLKDGMPLYTGFSGGLGILQVAPLDLKQVEFIKGSASTLYGGGAIAGLVNLITKTPGNTPDLSFLVNGNSGKGFDANGFYSQKWKNIGTTLFGGYNYNQSYDPSGTGLTAIPRINRFTFNPKIFLYAQERTTAWFGVNTTFEDRYGGDLAVLNDHTDSVHQYFERNKTTRISTQLSVTHTIDQNSKLIFKNSVGFLNRQLTLPNTLFSGRQWSSYSEAGYVYHRANVDWVAGINEWTERFTPLDTTTLNYSSTTFGAFVQQTCKINERLSLESGVRLDYSTPATKDNSSKLYLLPSINALFRLSPRITSRIGGGLGYKTPTPFIDDAEKTAYKNILPVNSRLLNSERSYGVHADMNYRARIDELTVNINQLFFYTRLDRPIILQGVNYVNAPGYIDTKGAETNVKVSLGELSLYAGYTYTDAIQHYNGLPTIQPLTAKHRISADITYEIENSFRFGLESFYTSRQQLSDGTMGRPFITFGALVQKMWKHFSVFINAENLTDQRQTRWGSIYSGSITHPVFNDSYTSLEGAIVNAGVKIRII